MDFFDLNPTTDEEIEDEEIEEEKPKLDAIQKATDAPKDLLSAAATEMGVVIPAEKAKVLKQFLQAAKYGHQASLSMKCRGHGCAFYDVCPLRAIDVELPLGKQCHPPGTKVLIHKAGYVPIEESGKYKKIITYDTRHSCYKPRGRKFSLHSRHYDGTMVRVTSGEEVSEYTNDHICIAKWAEEATGLWAVYLMYSGEFWRVGKTRLIWQSENGKKRHSGLAQRARAEGAKAAWILGVYKTNTEALLAEEYFSVAGQIPKSLFWVSDEQLKDHHLSLRLPICHYAKFLSGLGLSIDSPIWRALPNRPSKNVASTTMAMQIAAANLIPEYMEILVAAPDRFGCKDRPSWQKFNIEKFNYTGPVYSLDVEKEHTYIADNIVTHNCPVETALIQQWVNQFVDSLGIEPDEPTNAVEMHMIYELAGLELIRRRAAHELSQKPELVNRDIVGYSPQGDPIYDDKPSQALLILERQSKIVNKLRDSLLATPKAQSQAGQPSRDLSTRTANIMEKALEIQKMRMGGKSIQDAEFEVQNEEPEAQEQGERPDETQQSPYRP